MKPRALLIPFICQKYLYSDLDHDQDGIEIEVPKSFSFIFPKEEGKYFEMLEWQNQTLATLTTISTKIRKF